MGGTLTFFHFITLFSFFSYKLQYVLEMKEHCVRVKNKSKRTKSTDFLREVLSTTMTYNKAGWKKRKSL